MNNRDKVLSSAIKGWLAGWLAGTACLFLSGLVMTALGPNGLSLSSLLAGLFLSMVHLIAIFIYTAIPAAIFMWITYVLRIEYLILFAAFGGLLGWPVNNLSPLTSGRIFSQFIVAGIVAGIVAWFVMRKSRRSLGIPI